MPQHEVNRCIVDAAKAGQTVVRLKGGDPTLFARAAEELAALRQHAIPYEIVPGVTAALGVASMAEIPLTHRQKASCVALVTGQESPQKSGQQLDFSALARFPGTLVIYMGVTTVDQWSRQLIEAGMAASTPVAIVRKCTLPTQQVLPTTLGDVAAYVHQGRIRPPALFVVGNVADVQTESWFSTRPLFGVTVLNTRPAQQAESLTHRLAELGANVIEQPAIEIGPPTDWKAVDEVLTRLQKFDWIVFSSANGVSYFLDRLIAMGHDLRALGRSQLAAIGSATSEALLCRGLSADKLPGRYRAEDLADALLEEHAGERFLLIRASRGREVLADRLVEAGSDVEQVVAYESRDVPNADQDVLSAMAQGDVDWTIVTSSAIARSLVKLFGDALHQTKLAAISPLTAGVLRELGFEPAIVAEEYTTDGIVTALRMQVNDTNSRQPLKGS